MLKNLKSLFIVTEEEQNTSKSDISSAPPKAAVSPATMSSTLADAQGKVDTNILDKLLQALEDNNQPGFDYFEFRKAILSLNPLQMDEATKFQSTFATAATVGATLEKLIESIEFYKKVLLTEEANFSKAIKEQTAVNIKNKITERDNINASIKEKTDKISKLTEEIRSHESEIQKLNSAIEVSEMKIKETSLNFERSFNVIKSQLEQDALKLRQYIK
jgi:cell division protein FtsB